MLHHSIKCLVWAILIVLPAVVSDTAAAAELTVKLGNAQGVTFVGAIQRWDRDGNHRRLPNPKAKIDAPAVDAVAVDAGGGRWVFKGLSEGKYDLVVLANCRRRWEGFQYVPVNEFDPFLSSNASVDAESRRLIVADIAKSRHYENKVEPLYLAGNDKAVRVLVMLIRDKPTSYEADLPGAATIRHEIWQYTWNYGGWQKEKRTKVLDRVLLPRDELRKWTWLWDSKLGGIDVGKKSIAIEYRLSRSPGETKLKGLYPY